MRYTQLIELDPSGDYIGLLLSTNEQILAALSLYDRWSHPVDLLDPDDEAEAAELAATAQGKKDDAASLTMRTKQMNLGNESRHGELNHLQDRQKAEVQRHLRRQESYQSQRQQSAPQRSNPKEDLADLMFDSPSGLPEPMNPVHASDVDSHDSLDDGLSDFSDYSSSDEEDYRQRQQQAQAASTPASSSAHPGGVGASHRGYTQFLQPEEQQRFNKNQNTSLAESGEEDPFADPFADQGDVLTPGISEKQRMEWRAV